MPDIAERSTDIGVAQSTAPATAVAQISAAFLWNVDMMFSLFGSPSSKNRQFPSCVFDAYQQKF
jgi:hypothetical protein